MDGHVLWVIFIVSRSRFKCPKQQKFHWRSFHSVRDCLVKKLSCFLGWHSFGPDFALFRLSYEHYKMDVWSGGRCQIYF